MCQNQLHAFLVYFSRLCAASFSNSFLAKKSRCEKGRIMRKIFFFLGAFFIQTTAFSQSWIFRLNTEQDKDIEGLLYSRENNAHPNIKPYVVQWMPTTKADTTFQIKGVQKWRPWVQNRHWFTLLKPKGGFFLSPLRSVTGGIQSHENNPEIWMWGGGFTGSMYYGKKLSAQFRWEYFNEHPVNYVDSLARKNDRLPGIGTPHRFSNRLEYTFPNFVLSYAPSSALHLSVGNGKFFLGDGYRSLLLSDGAPNYPYASLQGRFWKIRYLSVAARWTDTRINPGNPDYRQYKFSSIHYLSWNIVPRLNFSLFESIVYQNRNSNSSWGVEPNYLNPVIFFRPVEYAVGSTDNALLGASIRLEILKQWFLYGQIMLDEFYFSQIRKFNGWQDNKQAFQGGLKGFDVGGVKGLFLQGEINWIRPYTYFHKNTLQNYSHSLQAMAHPLGANLIEGIFQTSYLRKKWYFSFKANVIRAGMDGYSQIYFGQNIFGNYFNRPHEFNNTITQGVKTNIINTSIKASYVLNRLTGTSFECSLGTRSLSNVYSSQKSSWFMLGLKSNLDNFYRDY